MKRLLAFALLFTACASLQAPKPEIDAAIEQAIAAKRIPGGVLWIEHRGTVYHRAYGNRALVPAVEPMTRDTIFDAASITKVVATAPSIWLLIERGKLALDAPVKTYLPEYADERVTIRHLLTHTSGIHPSLDLHGNWRGEEAGVRRALAERPRNAPGAIFRYSDVNYILLGEIVRRVSGERLRPPQHLRAPRHARHAFRTAAGVPRRAYRASGGRDVARRRARPDREAHGRRRRTRGPLHDGEGSREVRARRPALHSPLSLATRGRGPG